MVPPSERTIISKIHKFAKCQENSNRRRLDELVNAAEEGGHIVLAFTSPYKIFFKDSK